MINFIINFLIFFTATNDAIAGGAIVAAVVSKAFAATIVGQVVAFAINMVASSIISKIFAPSAPGQDNLNAQQPNPGNRQQLPPAGDNKLPVVYGTAFVGGIITDMSISSDNQDIYWVMSLCEVTNTETGGSPDTITFGNVYWGGKRVIFNANGYSVDSLTDESTGETQNISGNMDIYLYRNGSGSPTNSSINAVDVMSASNLVYKWNSTKLMSNTAFAIVHLKYNADRALTGLNQTRFQITNARKAPGDCFLDYLSSERYGAAISLANINTASLTALNTYSNASFTYTPYTGGTSTQPRFEFNGSLDTNLKIMQNIQAMADCCDCLVKYNEVTGQWGVVTQTPSYSVVMDVNDTNMIGGITVSPIDLNNSFNVIEVKFPDGSAKDSFNSATFDLATVAPTLLFANEPVNKQSVNLYLTNNNVTAQYLANRMLEAAREDLQIQVEINFIGLELEAGDIVTVTNANYGWSAKLFRINKVIQKFGDDGTVTASLYLMEYNPQVYDDRNITQFTPSPNTGIGSPITFGTVPAPVIVNALPTATNPAFSVRVTSSSAGITQYAEVWYSAYSNPTADQRIFAGTTAIQSNGTPYTINQVLPDVQLFDIPQGDWYFFSRMVNQLATSDFSPASTVYKWRPSTFQFTEKYITVAYGTSITGAGFSFSPTGKTYYGLHNQNSTTPSTSPSEYTWYLADPAFGTTYYLTYSNRTGRKMSFDTGLAAYAAGTAAFVPTVTALFDPTIWSALPDGINVIDLDNRTGQLINTGTTSVGTGEIGITNSPDGKIVAQLQQFLNFGAGVYTYTGSASTLTIDIYGRVVGFSAPDNFYMTIDSFTATSAQTVFTPTTRVTGSAGYITGQDLVFRNGVLFNPTLDYTENATTVTLNTGAVTGDIITIISFRSVTTTTGTSYASFSRNIIDITTPSSTVVPGFTLDSGYELLFTNGAVMSDTDYDIVAGNITNFPSPITGKMTVIQWAANNLGVPNGTPVNISINTVVGQTTYTFSYTTGALNLFMNGLLLLLGTDYTTASGSYTLTNTPTTTLNEILQQSFARAGAA
jgi:hypothetical protein